MVSLNRNDNICLVLIILKSRFLCQKDDSDEEKKIQLVVNQCQLELSIICGRHMVNVDIVIYINNLIFNKTHLVW